MFTDAHESPVYIGESWLRIGVRGIVYVYTWVWWMGCMVVINSVRLIVTLYTVHVGALWKGKVDWSHGVQYIV